MVLIIRLPDIKISCRVPATTEDTRALRENVTGCILAVNIVADVDVRLFDLVFSRTVVFNVDDQHCVEDHCRGE